MENKEKKVRGRERARSAVIGAGVAQGLIAAINVVVGAMSRNLATFAVWGLAALAVAVLFLLFKHPAWGIAGTALYFAGRVWTAMALLTFLWDFKGGPWDIRPLLVGLVLGGLLAVALLAFFIYADCQAFKLRRFEVDAEESE